MFMRLLQDFFAEAFRLAGTKGRRLFGMVDSGAAKTIDQVDFPMDA